MHARIATARVKPGTASAVQNGWQELLASYQDTGVCHGLISLMSADNVAVTLTLWESSEAADAVAAALREKAQAVFAEVLLEPPAICAYSVLLATATAAAVPPVD